MPGKRHCLVCNTNIDHLRSHAKTCTAACRAKLFRINHDNAYVTAKVTKLTYVNIVLAAFAAGKTPSQITADYLQAAFK